MEKIIKESRRLKNKVIREIITLMFPTQYLKLFYKNNINKVNWNGKKSCFTLSFDSDFRKDVEEIPRLLDILSLYSFKASFACIGKFIEQYPKIHSRILEEGHEILNHTYTHPDNEELNKNKKFNELSVEEQKYEIEKCNEVCKKLLNYKPIGFRIPHFGRLYSKNIYRILKEVGYKYSSSTLATKTPNFGLPFNQDGLIEFPLSSCPMHPFGVFDTWHSLKRGNGKHKKIGEFYALFKKLVDFGITNNSYINVYFDPQDIIDLRQFKQILDYLEEKRKYIWIATYKDIFEEMYDKKRG